MVLATDSGVGPSQQHGSSGRLGVEPASPACIEVSSLVKSFKGRCVLDSISFRIEAGECVSLLGPNGAGKTTTLLIILGVISPDGGEVRLRGFSMPGGRRPALEKTGFAAGNLSLPDLMRVREALLVFADFYGVSEPRKRVEEVIDLFGIRHLGRSLNVTLSAGQRTIVNLAKAVLCSPEVLILDEPTASLDPDVSRRVRCVLQDLRKELGCTTLVTSHNMREVEELAERVIFLHRGRVVADGPPGRVAEALGAENLEDAFVELAEVGRAEEGGVSRRPQGAVPGDY